MKSKKKAKIGQVIELSEEYKQMMTTMLGEDKFSEYIKSLDEKQNFGFILNKNKIKNSSITVNDIVDKFCGKILYENENYLYVSYDKQELENKNISPGKDVLHHIGAYYIQEPSASYGLSRVAFEPDDVVLDMCASPGGKTMQALFSIDEKSGGFVVANEFTKSRLAMLLSNIERMGFSNVIVTSNDAATLAETFNEFFDKIILDVPCSGEGMMRKNDTAKSQWSISLIKDLVKLQKELIFNCYKMLKKGGLIIYSTCTFNEHEDDENVSYATDELKLTLVEKRKIFPFDEIVGGTQIKGEGQFYAILKKEGELMKHNPCNISYNIINTNEATYMEPSSFPKANELININVVARGTKVFDKNDNLGMTHSLAHINYNEVKGASYNEIELNDNDVKKYLLGETISTSDSQNGIYIVKYKNMGLGLGKIVNGILKNHYPKGLRNLK